MALYRTVHLSFWTDPTVVDEFTPEDKLFYLYLLTNPHTNLCGCYEISVKQIALEIGYSVETVNSLIARFTTYHKVIKYNTAKRELLVLNWSKYNWTDSPKFKKALLKEIETVKTDAFRGYIINLLENNDAESEDDDTVSEDDDTVSEKINTVSDFSDTSVTDTDTDIVSDTDTVTDDFGVVKIETVPSQKKDAVKKVAEAWNSLELPTTVTKVSANSERGKMLNARIREYGADKVVEVIQSVKDCPFLMGDNDKGWVATFDWIIKPSNFEKTMSGNYRGVKNNRRSVGGCSYGNTGRESYPRGKIGITL